MTLASFASRLFVAVLLLQTLLIPALCLAAVPQRVLMDGICSSPGALLTPSDDHRLPPSDHAADEFCPACTALPGMPDVTAPAVAAPQWAMPARRSWLPAAFAPGGEHARAPPFESTGPPSTRR